MFKRFKAILPQFQVTRCIVICISLGRGVINSLSVCSKSTGVRQVAVTVVKNSICAVMLYDPWIIIKPILIILPVCLNFIPILNTMPIVKMIIIYGLDFVIV